MRKILLPGVCGLFLVTVLGCSSDSAQPPKTPATMIELPKQGPVAAGSGGGGQRTSLVPEKKNTTD